MTKAAVCGMALMMFLTVVETSSGATCRESTVELNDYLAYESVRQDDGTVRRRRLPSEKVAVYRKMSSFDLENDSVKLTVVPELGGRIWRAYDKRNNRDVVYYNHAAKTVDGLPSGISCVGGIAFDAGCDESLQPVAGFCRTNSDGSASCWLEPLNRTAVRNWRAEVRLAPTDARFRMRIEAGGGSALPALRESTVTAFFPARERPECSDAGAPGTCGLWWPCGGCGVVLRTASADRLLTSESGGRSDFTDYDGPFVALCTCSKDVEWQLTTNHVKFLEMTKSIPASVKGPVPAKSVKLPLTKGRHVLTLLPAGYLTFHGLDIR